MAVAEPVVQTAPVYLPRFFVVLMVVFAATSCGERAPERSAPLALRFSGCAEWRRDGTCELAQDRTLTFWIAGVRPETVKLLAEGSAVSAARAQIEGGARLRVQVPVSARSLDVRQGARAFRLSLKTAESDERLERARRLRAEGLYSEARALLEPFYDSSDLRLRAHVRGLLARLYVSEGDVEHALVALQDAAHCAHSAGLLLAEARNHLARADVLKRLRGDLTAAHEALSHISPEAHEFLVSAEQMKASLSLVAGDLRTALRLARSAARDADRLALPSLNVLARHVELLTLAELGRLDDGRRVHAQLSQAPADTCERGRTATNGSWLELVAEGDPLRAYAYAEQAVATFTHACKDVWEEQNARVNLALAAFKLGRLRQSRTLLEQAVHLGKPAGWVRAWQQEIEAELDLREGKVAQAIEKFRALSQREEQGGPIASYFRALLGLGRAALANGDRRAAEVALRRAEDQLDLEIRAAPLGLSRDAFASNRLASAELLVELLLDEGDAQAALEVARRARIRPLSSLAARGGVDAASPQARATWERASFDYRRAREALEELHRTAWSVPANERAEHAREGERLQAQLLLALEEAHASVPAFQTPLTKAEQGVIDLYFFPTERGLVGFARTPSEVVAIRLPADAQTQPVAFAQQLVRAFAERIRAAREVRVVPYGALRSVDFQALPFEQGLLIDHAFVRYGIDVDSDVKPPGSRAALLVVDPRGDLPGARREGAWVREKLRANYESVTVLSGSEVTLSRTRALLPDTAWFHFAGHGKATVVGAGPSAELILADGTVLEAGDIFALPRVPETVVLAGCETGVDDEHAAFGWGMAQAFVVRGASSVIATQRAVSDETAASFVRAVYADAPPSELGPRVRAALSALRAAGAEDWTAFRMYSP